jgi:CSLREA domain-containing protein
MFDAWRWIAVAGVLLLSARASAAATFTVTTATDTLDGACDADCSLREAVAAANAVSGADTIVLGPGVFTLSRPGHAEDAASLGDLDLLDIVRIRGAGAAQTIVDGGGVDRVFDVHADEAEITDLTVRGGLAAVGFIAALDGGGIRNLGRLTLARVVVTGNTSANHGGGVVNLDRLTIADSTIAGNSATIGGGIASLLGTIELVNTTLSGNHAEVAGGLYGQGEGFDSQPGGTVAHTTITGNTAESFAGTFFPVGVEPGFARFDPEFDHTLIAGNLAQDECECGFEVDAGFNLLAVLCGDCSLVLPPALGLAPLGEHGGPTLTHALLPGSPAIDSGAASCLGTDQRGRPRPADGNGDGVERCDIGAVEAAAGECLTGGDVLCLLDGRFRVSARFSTAAGASGDAQAVALTQETGYFWFFHPANVELLAKLLDACSAFERFWVFLAGLTDVEVTIEVLDTHTGVRRSYSSPQGRPFAPQFDTDAFAGCP